ncbi:MAG: PIN domain-containing protein, partial [Coriobacteriia bacterium]|nr:PIN domain-containing protein [Coriobacteriia bacterium]
QYQTAPGCAQAGHRRQRLGRSAAAVGPGHGHTQGSEHGRGGLATPVTILAETMSFIGARLGTDQQRRFWDAFMESGIEIIGADDELLRMAREIDRRYADLALGFADCTLLAACERERVAVVLSFDTRLTAYRPTFAPAIVLPR